MALDIYGPNSHLANDSCDLALFEAARRLDCLGPILQSIEREFYGDLTIPASSVSSLRAELVSLQRAYRSEIEPGITKAKKVHARDPERYESILLPILQREILQVRLHPNAKLTPKTRRLLVDRVRRLGWPVARSARHRQRPA
jgi:hypothetical protein